jgi:hypothetical protein
MPAPVVPDSDIPALAHQITPEQRALLAAIQHAGFMRNHDLDSQMAASLQELLKRGLVDPAYEGSTDGSVSLWISNGNGQRVLRYLTGIRSRPHYELPAHELAAWLEAQGDERWWSVDGDPLLTGRLDFPCPADELATESRQIGQSLLVQARLEETGAKGQRINRDKLDAIAVKIADSLHLIREGQLPSWSGDRLLYLCWNGSTNDWLLCEDSEAAKEMRASDGGKTVEAADVK